MAPVLYGLRFWSDAAAKREIAKISGAMVQIMQFPETGVGLGNEGC